MNLVSRRDIKRIFGSKRHWLYRQKLSPDRVDAKTGAHFYDLNRIKVLLERTDMKSLLTRAAHALFAVEAYSWKERNDLIAELRKAAE